nr:unnamed protein product [Callosobruchus analis]
MPLRGKQADEGVLLDLLKLRIDSGDNKLKSHFEKCRRNAIYTSPRIQNELINLCGEVIQENVISEVRKTMAYSILADETADVSGKEQLSIGVRFYDESKSKIREEFVGFVELKAQNASAIAEAIDNFLISSNLSKEDCVGFGFDGCSTMAGKEGGVQAILRKKYPRALYFHCSSHKLNLVVNDANAVPEIRNTVATVKDVITFFRESTTRRNYAPNLSRLCETRWSEKYKSIRKFSQHFSELVKSLETLSVEGNYATRKSAYQLHSAVTKPVFIVSLQTIAKYSAVIEPVVNALQAKSIDMISVGKHIKNIKDILRNDREFPDRISNEILQKARAVAMDLNIEISVPRLAHKQTHRSNPPSDNDNEYWRRSLIIPYIDSLISSLNIRFSQENTPAFALSRLHPLYMTKTSIADLHKNAESFQEFYNLDITGELNLWHNLWVTKALSDDQLKDIEVVDLFKEANIFYPAVRKALIILSTIPCTTATVERSFSTLRRVKTWLRSTMGEERLTVCSASHFINIVSGKHANVIEQVNTHERETIEKNRKKLKFIVSTILFCGTHDIALRGKQSHEGNFNDLLRFRVESGDTDLSTHLETCHTKHKYTSVQIQNNLIEIAGGIIRQRIVSEVNDSEAFSILADETADISGHEQLSLGVRFVDKQNNIREEFLGFEKLCAMDAKTIACTIIQSFRRYGVNLRKLIGLGFDGCSTMAGKDNGVQKLIRDEYPLATYFHCSSHRLNLVVNYLNTVQQIQNTIGTIKEIITFFRDSPKRRSTVKNIPLLSEARWTSKYSYKSLRIFSENLMNIISSLENMSMDQDFNLHTRTKANIFLTSVSNPLFLICLKLYPAHIDELVVNFQNDREDSEKTFSQIFKEVEEIGKTLDVEIKMPRTVVRQTHRSNIPATSAEQYFRLNIFNPYLDSLIMSLKSRFSEDSSIGFSLSLLHPKFITSSVFLTSNQIESIIQKYDVDNLAAEYATWVASWKTKGVSENMDICDLFSNYCVLSEH